MSVSTLVAEPSTQPSDYVQTSAATTTPEGSGEEGSGEEGSGDGEHMENGHSPRGLSRLQLSKYSVRRNPHYMIHKSSTVVPALGDPRRERPPAVCGHFVNVQTHFKVKLPVISGHLPNADADSHVLVVSTCYNGQCK